MGGCVGVNRMWWIEGWVWGRRPWSKRRPVIRSRVVRLKAMPLSRSMEKQYVLAVPVFYHSEISLFKKLQAAH